MDWKFVAFNVRKIFQNCVKIDKPPMRNDACRGSIWLIAPAVSGSKLAVGGVDNEGTRIKFRPRLIKFPAIIDPIV